MMSSHVVNLEKIISCLQISLILDFSLILKILLKYLSYDESQRHPPTCTGY